MLPFIVQICQRLAQTCGESSTRIYRGLRILALTSIAAAMFSASCFGVEGGPTISNDEKATLRELYTSTNGSAWTTRTGWLGVGTKSDNEECTWYGVVCTRQTDQGGLLHVTELSLGENNLSGSLPDLSGLGELVSVDFTNNRFSGPLATINHLTKLQTFWTDQ